MKADFSQAYSLLQMDDWPTTGLKGTPGVYRIRAFKEGKPLPSTRFNGTDPNGILHIGMSGNLFQRLKSFRSGIKLNLHAHFGSRQFVYWRFDGVIHADDLRFDFIPSKNGKAAKDFETERHEAYRKTFLDRPPLDGTSGERPKIGALLRVIS
jgi:hypothetical protein